MRSNKKQREIELFERLKITLPNEESTLEKECHVILNEHRANGVLDWNHLSTNKKQNGIKFIHKGEPDIAVYLKMNHTVFFELKSSIGKLKPEQKETIDRRNKLGFTVYQVKEIEEFKNILSTEIMVNTRLYSI